MSDDQENDDALALTDELAKKYDPERMLKMVGKRAGRGDALDASLRAKYEKRYGVDLGHVRIFSGEFAEDFNRRHNSYAVTVGNTGMVMMGNSPDKSMASASGQALLAHELAHVAQQARRGAGSVGSGGLHRKGLEDMPFTQDDELEAEEHELAAYQQAMGSPLNADQENAKLSGKARQQSDMKLQAGIEKVKQRVVDMMGDAVKTQMMRNGSSRRA